MREAGLPVGGFNGVISGIGIGHQIALETGAENIKSDLTGTGTIDMEKAEVWISGKPEEGPLAVNAPVGFIAMNNIGRAHLVAQLLMNGLSGLGNLLVKIHGGSRNERKAEKLGKDFIYIAIGESDFMAQIDSRGFGCGTDLAIAQFSLGSLKNGPAAGGAESGVMPVGGDDGFGLENDVFLDLFLRLAGGLQTGGGAMRTNGGSRDLNNTVHMLRGGAVPRRMAFGSAAFAP